VRALRQLPDNTGCPRRSDARGEHQQVGPQKQLAVAGASCTSLEPSAFLVTTGSDFSGDGRQHACFTGLLEEQLANP